MKLFVRQFLSRKYFWASLYSNAGHQKFIVLVRQKLSKDTLMNVIDTARSKAPRT